MTFFEAYAWFGGPVLMLVLGLGLAYYATHHE